MLNHRLTGPLAAASAFCLTIGVASAQPAPNGMQPPPPPPQQDDGGGPGPGMHPGGPRHQQGPPGMPRGPMGPMGGMGMRGGPMRPMGGPPGTGEVRMQDATYLGVEVSPIDPAMKAQLKLGKTDSGLLVNFVADDSPAKQAGLQQYDVLTRLDDQILFNPPQLQSLVRIRAAGDEVKLSFIREGQTQTATAKLQTKQQMVSQMPFGPGMMPMPPMDGNFGGPGPGNAGMPARTISLETQDMSLSVSSENGKPVLVAKDKSGKELFNGSIETPEQRQAIPPEVRKELDKVAENYLVTSLTRPNRGFGPGWNGPQHGMGPGGRWRGGSEGDRQAGTQPAR